MYTTTKQRRYEERVDQTQRPTTRQDSKYVLEPNNYKMGFLLLIGLVATNPSPKQVRDCLTSTDSHMEPCCSAHKRRGCLGSRMGVCNVDDGVVLAFDMFFVYICFCRKSFPSRRKRNALVEAAGAGRTAPAGCGHKRKVTLSFFLPIFNDSCINSLCRFQRIWNFGYRCLAAFGRVWFELDHYRDQSSPRLHCSRYHAIQSL